MAPAKTMPVKMIMAKRSFPPPSILAGSIEARLQKRSSIPLLSTIRPEIFSRINGWNGGILE
jgi:hypothetical protein